MKESYYVEVCATILTVSEGKLKVMLIKNKQDWLLPKKELKKDLTLDNNIKYLINELGLSNVYIEQVKTYNEENKIIINYLVLTNNTLDYPLFESFEEHKQIEIIKDALARLSLYLDNVSILKYLFKETFTLPELLHVYEQVTKNTYDRRNFRKKLIKSGMIEELSGLSNNKMGRPAKLYKFNKGDGLYE